MFKGEYRFYSRGELVGAHQNLITTAGKAQILRYLAGATPQIGDTISVGIGERAATVSDTRLHFEADSQPLEQIGVDTVDPKLVFKTTLNPNSSIIITEVGLWAFKSSDAGAGSSRILTSADGGSESWLNAAWDANSRLSEESLLLTPPVNTESIAQFTTFNQDLSRYTNSDEFLVAYEAIANTASLNVYFHTSEQDYYTATVVNTGNGYKIAAVLKNDCVATGSPDWANIMYLRIGARATSTGAGTVRFDALRIERNTNIDGNSVLVSRSKLTTPIVKGVSEPLDIEYTVKLNL